MYLFVLNIFKMTGILFLLVAERLVCWWPGLTMMLIWHDRLTISLSIPIGSYFRLSLYLIIFLAALLFWHPFQKIIFLEAALEYGVIYIKI